MAFLREAFQAFHAFFWDEKFWLPESVTWKDFENVSDDFYHPVVSDLKYVILCGCLLFAFRKLYERYVAAPIGRCFGIRDTQPRKPPPNPVLEKAFRCHKFPDNERMQNGKTVPVLVPDDTKEALSFIAEDNVRRAVGIKTWNPYLFANTGDSVMRAYDSLKTICAEHSLKAPERITSVSMRKYIATLSQSLSKQTDLSTRKVERWFRMRRNQDRPSLMKRFTEAAWRFAFYFSVFIYGVIVLWDKPWFADSSNCWIGYPHHHIPRSIFWYYMIEIGFYSSLMFSQFIDVKRKDFWEMFTHHVATMLLLCFSWSGNFVRVGTLVLVIHDAVDFWMEAAKMAKYLKYQRLCDVLFAIFGVVWFVTRLIIFPMRIIMSTLFYAHPIVGFGPVYYTYNILLMSLQILHCVWTILIIRVLYFGWYKNRKEVTDIRSSEEENVSEDENGHAIQPNNNHNHNHNHNHHRVKAVS